MKSTPVPSTATLEIPDYRTKPHINITMMVPFLHEMIGLKKKRRGR